MKMVKKIFLVLILAVMVMPLTIKADDNKVNIYMFRGEGCPHCSEALEWFDSLDDKIKDKINLVQYETWHDKDNAALMKKVAKALGEDTSNLGVPFIVIGDKTFIGFADSYKDGIISKINEMYNQEDRFDVMTKLDENVKNENDSKAIYVIIGFIVIAVAVLIIVL